jgi:hypothetical protein
VVICLNVLDHVQAPRLVLKEMRRILKEDGELFLSLSLEDQDDQCHPHGFNLAGITELLRGSGFRIVKAQVTAEYQSSHRPFHFSSVCQPTSCPDDDPSPDDSASPGKGQATMHMHELETKVVACEAENLELRDLVRRYESGRLFRLTAKVANLSGGWRNRFSHLRDRISDLRDRGNRDLPKRGS